MNLFRRQRSEEQPGDRADRLVTISEPHGLAAEAYRTLRTNLLYSFVDSPPKVIVVSSPGPGEGKSTTCANLGVVLTQLQNNNVLLVDCDLRKPVLHKIFGYRNLTGIVSVLAGEYSMQDVWHGPEPGLKLITVGPIPPNPAELLSSQRFANFIEQARKEFDYVVLDASPIELVTDPTILAALCDGVLLVINAQTTRKRSARRSVQRLEAVGAQILGTVMNDAEGSVGSYYSSTYY